MKRAAVPSIFALALLAALSAVPVGADERAPENVLPAVAAAPAPAPSGCGETLDLANALLPQGETCSAEVPQNPAPEFMVGRTCRCSCGFPCKTDADCGPGGICSGGITCC
jgi:hypothetical protein